VPDPSATPMIALPLAFGVGVITALQLGQVPVHEMPPDNGTSAVLLEVYANAVAATGLQKGKSHEGCCKFIGA
jgi:hypothetical protein